MAATTARLIHGEALATLRTLDDASVDAVVTDPPFGIGWHFGGRKEPASNAVDYWRWFAPFHAEMMRVLKPGGLFACWQTQLYMRHFWCWYGDEIHVYAACKNFVQLRPTPINYGYDPVVMLYKPGAKPLRPAKPKRSVDFFVANTARVISDPSRLEKGHPSPRPLDATVEVVRNFTLPGGLVLDPFMGSGTTGVACLMEGRSFIGVEQEAAYVEIARKRIADAEHALATSKAV